MLGEGTAHLDSPTEAQILDIIAGLTCTRIMIAHRPKTLEVSDKVYQVINGVLVGVRKPKQ